jgi:transposase
MYREVTMLEVTEVLRLWRAGLPTKRLAAQLGLDPKTARRYLTIAERVGLRQDGPTPSDDELREVLLALHPAGGRPRGEGWAVCAAQRARIEAWLAEGVRLTKIRKLLARQGVVLPYPMLYRFAVEELRFGRPGPTMPVLDGEPGHEVQVDTGWVGWVPVAERHRNRRRFRAWIFTAVYSRHRFVYPTFEETTARAIEACEAAWRFFGGIFHVLIPDNTKAMILQADPLGARITPAFLDYAQARGFHIDAARVRRAQDKARVERSVPPVREDCFGGERLLDLEAARERGRVWALEEYGTRRHSRTQQPPLTLFEHAERPALLPVPTTPYDVPLWASPKVARDQLAQVARALYSIPHPHVGHKLTARADSQLVRFYDRGLLIKTHPRQPPGQKSIDPHDYPLERSVYALRNVQALQDQAAQHGESVARYAAAILDGPLPWTRMRRVYALLGLVRRFGPSRVHEACTLALALDMLDVRRLQRMLELGHAVPPATPARVLPRARYLRPASQYALPLTATSDPITEGETR